MIRITRTVRPQAQIGTFIRNYLRWTGSSTGGLPQPDGRTNHPASRYARGNTVATRTDERTVSRYSPPGRSVRDKKGDMSRDLAHPTRRRSLRRGPHLPQLLLQAGDLVAQPRRDLEL